MKRILAFILTMISTVGVANAALFESGTKDAQPMVLYGKYNNTIVPVKVAADGSVGGGGGVAGSDTQVQFNDGGAMAGDAGLTYNKTTDSLTLAGSLLGAGTYSLNLSDSHIQWLGVGDNIQTAITNATAGDTIYLASGSYTTTQIAINKSINIVGQGPGKTTINFSHTNDHGFLITASNVSISGLTINQTVSATSKASIRADGTAGTVLSGIFLRDVIVNYSATGTTTRALSMTEAGGSIYNSIFNILNTGSTTTNYACIISNTSTAEAPVTVNFYSSDCLGTTNQTTGTRTAIALEVLDFSATEDIIVNFYNSTAKYIDTGSSATVYGAEANGADAILNAYGSYFNGTDADAVEASGEYNNYASYSNGQRFMVEPPATQVIADGDSILIDACGTVKTISSVGNVTTNTTNSIVLASSRAAGCCMHIINIDSADTITIDNNTNTFTAGGADVALGPGDTAVFCNDGVVGAVKWYQVGATGNN